MTKLEGRQYKSDPTRAAKINSYCIDTLKQPNMIATIIVKGEKKRDEWPVYKIPRDEIRLNDANHRFANSKNELILERAKPERNIPNPHEFDMSDTRRKDPSNPDDLGGDVEQIREMIRGNFPVDDGKKGEYFGNEKALKNLMMTRRAVSGGSGQGVHAIVTPDGVLINGNRRECVLEDFSRESVAAGQDPDQFNHMLVAVCPKEITQDDIISMELFEQASRSSLARFSKIDFATAVNELYELKLKLLKTKPKTGEWHDGIVTTISKAPDGVNKQEIIDALNMYEFSKKVLNRIGRLHGKNLTVDKDLSRISINRPGESISVEQIMIDNSNKYYAKGKRALNNNQKQILINKIAAYVKGSWNAVKAQADGEEPDTGDHDWKSRLGSGHGSKESKAALWGDDSKFNSKTYWKNFDWKNDKSVTKFGRHLEEEIKDKKETALLHAPAEYIKSIKRTVGKLYKKFSGVSKKDLKEMKTTIQEKKGVQDMKTTVSQLSQIIEIVDPKAKKPAKKKVPTKKKSTKKKSTKKKTTRKKTKKRGK